MTTTTLHEKVSAEIEAYDKSITKEKREKISAELSKIYSDIAFSNDVPLSEQLDGLLKKTLEWYKEAVEREEHTATLFGVDLMLQMSDSPVYEADH